jgi:hypothetical protein
MSVWYIQTVTDIICKSAVDVTMLVPFEKSIVEVWLASPHPEESLHLIQKRKSSLRIETPSDLLTIKCPVDE